ncbi:hypothetical protein CPB86DRAFT_619730 [Serendipita vermifera]|nr:hypothetical protein CPB86DRAFT_619730 [Serendipita vermifera]
MSRDIRPNRAAARDYPPPPRSKYEEYEDEYPAVSRYFPQEDTGRSGRGYDNSRRPSQRDEYNDSGRYGQTTSSSGSLMDRIKVKSYDAPARTSQDDDRAYDTPRQSAATWARKPGVKQTPTRTPVPEERRPMAPEDDPASAGNTLWGRVVSAAGSLTVNVSKAWDSGPGDGPETPPGGESRLTKAMKAYYLERARAPIDLPHWLFDEHERMPTRHTATAAVHRNERAPRRNPYDDYEEDPTPAPAPARGALRDVYDRAASNTGGARKPQPSYPQSDSAAGNTGESKAVSRLRAMRDAKRAAAGTTSSRSNKYDEEYDGGGGSMEPATDVDRRAPRTGLPTRPGGRYN